MKEEVNRSVTRMERVTAAPILACNVWYTINVSVLNKRRKKSTYPMDGILWEEEGKIGGRKPKGFANHQKAFR